MKLNAARHVESAPIAVADPDHLLFRLGRDIMANDLEQQLHITESAFVRRQNAISGLQSGKLKGLHAISHLATDAVRAAFISLGQA